MLDDISTKLDNIIKNDSSNSSTITGSLDGIKKDIENLKDTDSSIFERLDTIDSQVSQIGEYLETHEEFAQALDASVKKLRDDVDNLGLDGKLNELD
jgi:chromosome segregation ATPase